MKLAILATIAALHPQHIHTTPTPTNCGEITKLVQLFGKERVLEQARKRGLSERTIAHIRRRCNLEDS